MLLPWFLLLLRWISVTATINDARLAMGGVAHKPWRLYQSEKFLTGKKLSDANFKEAAGMAMHDAKAYEYNAYKLKLVPRIIEEALQKASGRV
jgi:xanthine dehydrogenase YagS FAD-binding subunit